MIHTRRRSPPLTFPSVFTNQLTPFSTVSQNSLCVTTKLAQITVERENGCLGLTLRGGGEYPLIVTNVRPHGPVFKIGRIKPGDRLLRVDNVSRAASDTERLTKSLIAFALRFR